jgi:hypothetical protein
MQLLGHTPAIRRHCSTHFARLSAVRQQYQPLVPDFCLPVFIHIPAVSEGIISYAYTVWQPSGIAS